MKYVRLNAELIRSYLVWVIYLVAGLVAAIALLTVYQVDLVRFLSLEPRYLPVVPLAFIAQTSLTGLMIQLWITAKPSVNVFSDLTSTPWVRYALMMPGVMRSISPLCASLVEEVFFRGTVFLILIKRFPQTGGYVAIIVCTTLF